MVFNLSAQNIATFFDDDGMHLRWKLNTEAEAYNIYRKSDNGNWQKINDESISYIKSNTKLRALLGYQANVFLGMMDANSITSDLSDQNFKKAINDEKTLEWIKIMSVINHQIAEALGLIYIDKNVSKNQNYQYEIRAIVNENETNWAITSILSTKQKDVVPAVENLVGKGINKAVLLEWDKNQAQLDKGSVVTFHVYKAEDILGPFIRINDFGMLPYEVTLTDNTLSDDKTQDYIDKNLVNRKPYFYYLKAVNLFGIESLSSETIEVIPGNYEKPLAPSNIYITPLGQGASINWDLIEEDIQGVEIYKSEDGFENNEGEKIYPYSDFLLSNKTSYLDLDIKTGTYYYYRLRSVNNANVKSDFCTEISFYLEDIVPPNPPKEVFAKSGKNKINISWTPSIDKDVEGYYIHKAHYKNYKRSTPIDYIMIKDTFFVDEFDAKFQGEYGYRIVAIDFSGNKSQPSNMAKARIIDDVPPLKPIITSSDKNGNAFRFDWTKSSAFDFKTHQIYSSEDDQSYAKLDQTDQNFYEVAIEKDQLVYYKVSAIDLDNNESELSSAVAINSIFKGPTSPENGQIKYEENAIKIDWTKANDASVAGYLITKYINNENGSDIKEVKASEQLEFTDQFVKKNHTYLYEIRAYNKDWQFSLPLSLSIKVK